jgi:fatty acid desaturase
MAVAPRAKPEDFFSAREWESLTSRSSWRGAWLVAHCWAVIGAAMWIGAMWPLAIPLAIIVIGTRQLGLFVLMHDGAHALLHRDRRTNDFLASWLCSSTLQAYRPYHLQHHRFVQQTEDPDLVLSAPFPITRTSFARKVVRDLTGQTFAKQLFGPIRARIASRSAGESRGAALIASLAPNQRFLVGNALGFVVFTVAGWWWVWVALWLLPMATWLSLVSRVRNIAEHALIAQNEADPLRQARTTHANLVERALVAPYWVNYHCEHHMFTSVPCWNLPEAHRLLERARGQREIEVERGYVPLLVRACAA